MKKLFNISLSSRYDFAKHLQHSLGLNYNKIDQISKFLEMNNYMIIQKKPIKNKPSLIFRLSCIPFFIVLFILLLVAPFKWIFTGDGSYDFEGYGKSKFVKYFLKRFDYLFE